jgi:hypothetical protein
VREQNRERTLAMTIPLLAATEATNDHLTGLQVAEPKCKVGVLFPDGPDSPQGRPVRAKPAPHAPGPSMSERPQRAGRNSAVK